MKKTTKGALAASAAAVLLLGGAGSLAYWTSSTTADGGSLTSGSISLSDVTCDASWTYGGSDAGPSVPVTAIVPGDEVQKACTGTLTMVGDHIAATVAIDPASWSTTNALSSALQASATLTSPSGGVVTGPTPAGGASVSFTIDVRFPYGGPVSSPSPTTGADNTTQVQTATLNTINVVAVQTHQGAGVGTTP